MIITYSDNKPLNVEISMAPVKRELTIFMVEVHFSAHDIHVNPYISHDIHVTCMQTFKHYPQGNINEDDLY